MAQLAASIEYETVTRPAGLPDDMRALPGASLLINQVDRPVRGSGRTLAAGEQESG
jgi:hypothetical protein